MPRIGYTNKQHKTNHGSGKYSSKLLASKNSGYNKRNCKYRRHAQRNTFIKYKRQTKSPVTNKLYPDQKIKSRKSGTSKPPPPQRRDQMLRAISCRENCKINIDNDQYILWYNKPNLCNDYISMEQESTDRYSINFPRHYVLGYVFSDTNPLDEVDSSKEEKGIQPIPFIDKL